MSTAPVTALPVQVGQVIRGKYRIDRVLGEGGMGIVVAGSHVGLGQRVAIKFLHAAMLQHQEIVERFAREARAASKLESDHVARVTDVDALEDGTPFMVMEYLEGHDLSVVRASGQPLPFQVAVDYVLQACEAIGEAHQLGIIHRDIKPANLFLAKRAGGKLRVKVLDFGISKMDSSDGGITRTSTVVGSAHYMSPEQMLATRDVDARTDIWALGATLYELTTAQVPFPGDSVTQVAARVMTLPPPVPSSLRRELPPGLDSIVMRCLERELSRRVGSIAELVDLLSPLSSPLSRSMSMSMSASRLQPAAAASMGGASSPASAAWSGAPMATGPVAPPPMAAGPAASDGLGHAAIKAPFATQHAVSTTAPHAPPSRVALVLAVLGIMLVGSLAVAAIVVPRVMTPTRGQQQPAAAAPQPEAPTAVPTPPASAAETREPEVAPQPRPSPDASASTAPSASSAPSKPRASPPSGARAATPAPPPKAGGPGPDKPPANPPPKPAAVPTFGQDL